MKYLMRCMHTCTKPGHLKDSHDSSAAKKDFAEIHSILILHILSGVTCPILWDN